METWCEPVLSRLSAFKGQIHNRHKDSQRRPFFVIKVEGWAGLMKKGRVCTKWEQ